MLERMTPRRPNNSYNDNDNDNSSSRDVEHGRTGHDHDDGHGGNNRNHDISMTPTGAPTTNSPYAVFKGRLRPGDAQGSRKLGRPLLAGLPSRHVQELCLSIVPFRRGRTRRRSTLSH
eukprot:scaffold4535_cov179-Amphora_coffeaeformis.AAC.6